MAKSVRLKDIAKQAGVSTVTVSNALAGKKGVSEETRKRILAIASELGYSDLRIRQEQTENYSIGVIVSGRYIHIGSSFYWEMYQNLAVVFARRGLLLNLEILQDESADAPLPPSLAGGNRVDGLVVIGRVRRPFLDRAIQAVKGMAVLLDVYEPDLHCSAVMSANYIGMYRSARVLIELGHRDIGFVGAMNFSDNVRERYFGYRKALAEAGLPYHPEWCLTDRTENEMPHIDLPGKLPTAFACSSDLSADALYQALKKRGLSVPEDISITGYDNYLVRSELSDHVTTFSVDMKQMAERAADLLESRLQGSSEERVIYVDSQIIFRDSARRLESGIGKAGENDVAANINRYR